MKKVIFFLFAQIFVVSAAADTVKGSAAAGEELFMKNQPKEALVFLEKAVLEEPQNERLYEYLGICYQQLGRYDDAILIMNRGITYSRTNKHILYQNMGNNYFILQKYTFAEEMFTYAVEHSRSYPGAYLNRALVRIKLGKYPDAISDYTMYLTLEPSSSQRGKILEHIEAMKTILNQDRLKQEEKERLARELEAKEKALLNEVLSSLKNATEGTRNLSAGSEGLQEYEDELNIED